MCGHIPGVFESTVATSNAHMPLHSYINIIQTLLKLINFPVDKSEVQSFIRRRIKLGSVELHWLPHETGFG